MITLKLDGAAVRQLFPDNSEAKLQLQSAVITETLRFAAAGKLTDALNAQVAPLIAEAEKKAIDKFLQPNTGWQQRRSLTPEFEREVSAAVQKVYSQEMAKQLDAAHAALTARVTQLADYYQKELDKKLHTLTNDAVNDLIRQRVAHIATSIVDPLLKGDQHG